MFFPGRIWRGKILMKLLRFKPLVVVAVISLLACQMGSKEISTETLDVFRGFALVATGPGKFDGDGSLDVTYIVPHDDKEESRPDHLQTRTQYVFHSRSPTNDERLGLEDLPNRLRELGFQVLEAPKFNGGQFSYPYIGGPYFSITFMNAEHKGVIFNRVDGKIADKNWIVDDYVLVFLS
jgi:hypothetical protein